jgi:ABC-type antimicrobial peptide transport system ATPase subunit
MDIATTLSNSKRKKIYFKMRMIGLLFSVVKFKILSISNANHKKLWKNYIIVNASFFAKIINSDTLLFLNYSSVILRLINELTKIVAKISLVLVSLQCFNCVIIYLNNMNI